MISPNDLSYFMEIANTQNISRASERIGISQPSLTLAIKRIEQTLGTDILIRSKKGVSLTKAGQKLLKHSKSLVQYWEKIKTEALSSVNEVVGNISIGCHPSVGLYTLEKFLPSLLGEYPELEVSLHHDLSRNIAEQVISMKIDVGLVINPVKHPDLIIKKLLEDTVTLWSSGKNEDVLICDPELLQTQDIMKRLKKRGFKFSRVITTSSLENVTSLCSAGVGVGIVPTRIVKRLGQGKISKLQNAPSFIDHLCVVYRVENKNVQSLKETIRMIIHNIK